VEEHRSTWQSWHVRAEAHRHVRAVQVPTNKVDQLVELLVNEVLHTQSISLTRRDDGITEPVMLRRIDGSSVYTVAGSELFTSARILAAEQRLVAIAGPPTAGSWKPALWIWRCWNRPPTGTLWMPGSVGDLVITRADDRRLRITATDWVKNGDRWTILNLTGIGGVRVRHVRNGRTVTLSAGYVSTATGLGYASTVHTAQDVTADTVHGVVTGEESRQQLYTMVTRGRAANHIYVSAVGNGDPHTVMRPDTILPSTATELLEQILARDGSPRSASTLLREQQAPAVRLGESVGRYLDALHLAAEDVTGSSAVQAVETAANQLLPGLSDEPAWPTLRSHLLLLAAAGADPVAELLTAAAQHELTSAHDQAAVIDSRIQDVNKVISGGAVAVAAGRSPPACR
jgi:hypothetical protein